jgi:hypothetical protein
LRQRGSHVAMEKIDFAGQWRLSRGRTC